MVGTYRNDLSGSRCLSVLALSSRFDGPMSFVVLCVALILSVLALSSRFDGPVYRVMIHR